MFIFGTRPLSVLFLCMIIVESTYVDNNVAMIAISLSQLWLGAMQNYSPITETCEKMLSRIQTPSGLVFFKAHCYPWHDWLLQQSQLCGLWKVPFFTVLSFYRRANVFRSNLCYWNHAMGIQEDVSAKDYSSARNLEFVCDQWYLESVWETIILFYIFMIGKKTIYFVIFTNLVV